ncbi:MAG: hypothetical protein ACE14P_01785 [Methanotrichaceae archaeon]
MQFIELARSLLLFPLAGLCEIRGGRAEEVERRRISHMAMDKRWKGNWFAVLGAAILALYGIIPTFQPANFGRVYAAYGGIFIILPIN